MSAMICNRSLKSFINALMAACLLVGVAACSSENGLDEPEFAPVVPEEVTLTFNLPAEQTVGLATRADVPAISKMTILYLDNSGKILATVPYTSGWTPTASGYTMKVKVEKNTYSLQIVTNCDVAANTFPSSIFTAESGVMWGEALLSDMLKSGSQLTLIRMNAKVSAENKTEAADEFSIEGIAVNGTASEGSVAPLASNYSAENHTATAPTCKAGEPFTFDSGMQSATAQVALFETPNPIPGGKFPRIIIKGKYHGVEGYYVAAFRTRTGADPSEVPGSYTYQDIPVLRNHHYILSITKVRAYGWQTYEEALKAEPDNRLTVEITDKDDSITDIIATRDYMLGIGGDITVDYNASASVSVLTTYSGDPTFTADQEWVKAADANLGSPEAVSGMTSGTNAAGRLYTVTIPLTANERSTEARVAHVTVRCGDLTRTFTLTQNGHDLRRDDNRKIRVSGIPELATEYSNDYIRFLDEGCHGLSAEANRGIARDNGLHFPAANLYYVSYSIPKLAGDKAEITSGNFNVVPTNNDWVVKVNHTYDTPTLEIGNLKITNSQGAEINYTLYRTGIFHEMKAEYSQYCHEGEDAQSGTPAAGWYYYEVVNVNGKYILDRNLGASSNQPYISTYSGFAQNTSAIGAYFKIATEKSTSTANPKTILSKLGLGSFKIPSRDDVINTWGVTVSQVSSVKNEVVKVATIRTQNSLVADNVVYLPHGGYYDGYSLKYETHANIWTSTLLAGNQGFSTASPEFGYWYLYIDIYGSKVGFSNMRFCNGSAGAAPTEESVYKYMPLRLQWN